MNKEITFKIFGILTFIFELMMIFGLIISNRREPVTFDIQTITRISSFHFLTIATAVGLMYQKRWAALGFSLANLSFALWLIIGSLLSVPFPFMFYNFAFGSPFLLIGIAFLLEVFPSLTSKTFLK